jgi:hypothetical protein
MVPALVQAPWLHHILVDHMTGAHIGEEDCMVR